MPSGPASIRVTSLAGGISTQPQHLRLPDQVGDGSVNVVFDMHSGARKRPGSRLIRRLGDFSTGNHIYRMWGLDYGEDKFLLVLGESSIKLKTADGQDTTLDITEVAQDYLDLESPEGSDFRVRRGYGDDVLIVNTLVKTRADSSPSYSLTAQWPDYDVLTSQTPTADAQYHEAENDTPEVPAGFYQYDVDGLTFAYWTGANTSSTDYSSPSGFWNDAGKNPGGFKVAFRKIAVTVASGDYDHTAKTLIEAGAFTNYSWEEGDHIYITGGTGVTANQWVEIASRDSANQITLAATPAGASANQTDWTADKIGAEFAVTVNIPERPYEADMYGIARIFQQALRDAGCEDGTIAWVFSTPPNGRFVIGSRWRGSGAAVLSISAPASGHNWSASGRPFEFAAGVATPGTGSAAAGNETKPVEKRWSRVPPSDSKQSVPARNRLPMVLRRNGTFKGKPRFILKAAPWKPRLDGDELTNPAPKFMRQRLPVRDVCSHRNRLVIMAGRYTMFSAATEPYTLYLADADQITDADPFELELGGDKATEGEFLVPFLRTLVATTTAGQQYELSTPDSLTPETAAWTATTRHDMLAVRPAVMHEGMYFVSRSEEGQTHLFEYTYDDIRVSTTAESISVHVEGLLPSDVTAVVAEPGSGCVAILPAPSEDPGTNEVFVYQTLYRNRQRVQSAWTRWEFPSGWKIRDICVLGRDLFMLVDDGARYMIDAVPLDHPRTPEGYAFYPHMDRWFEVTGVHAAGTTTWTYPQTLGAVAMIVLEDGTLLDSSSAGWSASTTQVSVTGNYASQAARLGTYAVDAVVEFTRPYNRDDQGRPDIADDVSILALTAAYKDTGELTLTVQKTGTTDRSRSKTTTAIADGNLDLIAGGLADRVTYIASDDSVKPMNIVGLKWSLQATTRFV